MTTDPSFEQLTWERHDHVVRIGLNRPAKRNAFSLTMLRELAEAYTAYDDDEALRCAVLHAHGQHFTGGLDLAEVGPAVAEGQPLFPADHVDPIGLGPRRVRKPVVVAVQGWCLTIGMELALAADITIAATSARLAQLEVKRGIMAFGGATLRLPAIAGWGNAMRYLLTGDELSAEEAYRIGFVQELVPDERLLERATSIAQRVAAQAPLAVQATLASCRHAREQGPEAEVARLLDRARALMGTEDAAEGMRSFLERREGRFTGR